MRPSAPPLLAARCRQQIKRGGSRQPTKTAQRHYTEHGFSVGRAGVGEFLYLSLSGRDKNDCDDEKEKEEGRDFNSRPRTIRSFVILSLPRPNVPGFF